MVLQLRCPNPSKSSVNHRSAHPGGGDGDYQRGGHRRRGLRVARTQGATTNYVHDRTGGLPRVIDDGARRYVTGPGGLAYSLEAAVPTVYHVDALGSVRALSDASGALAQSYGRDAWGNPLGMQGSSAQPFGFTGELNDSETGLLHLRARDYDPVTGRFLQRDTVLGSTSLSITLHRYIDGIDNPVSRRDPSGRCLIVCQVLIGAAIGGTLGVASYVIHQAVTGERITTNGIIGNALLGGALGASVALAAPLLAGTTLLSNAAYGAVTAAASETFTEAANNQPLSPGSIIGAAVVRWWPS